MKVVLFCGGLGLRLREYSEHIPKPMVNIGYRPVLWHVMRYYAHFGHKDFVLCLGYKADVVKRYFLDYDETLSNDFVLSGGGRKVDVLTDAPLAELVEDFKRRDAVAAFVRVPPSYSFHVVGMKDEHHVSHIEDVKTTGLWLNGGYFIFRQDIFDYLYEGEELVEEPFQRLIQENKLISYPHEGFWAPMDTVKERQALETMVASGRPPWAVWQGEPSRA